MNYAMIAGAIVIAISAATFTRFEVTSWVDVKCIVSKLVYPNNVHYPFTQENFLLYL